MIVIAKRSDHGVSETSSIQIARNIGYDIRNWNLTTNNKKLDRKGQRKIDAFAVFHVFQIMSEASETNIFITVFYLTS